MDGGRKYKILIVDDDKFLLDMYSVKFRERGFFVVGAFGGEEALAILKNKTFLPDVVLLELVMPKTDGFEILRQAKKEHSLTNTVCVVLSNLGEKNDIKKARECGADDYIIKAASTPSEVVERVIKTLEQKHGGYV